MASEQLSRLSGDVAQPGENRSGGREEPVFSCRGGQLAQSWAENEAPLHVAGDQAMVFQSHREAVGGGSRETRGGDETGQGGWTRLQGGQDEGRFVKNADSARVVHALILPYRMLRRKFIC